MIAYQYLRISAHLLAGLWTCAVVFPRTDAAGRERRIQRWSGQLLAICGVQLEVRHLAGQQPASHAMIVANHVSWLDIFVINSHQPCRFVAKSDVRDWPLIGWLSSKAGTVFLARGNRRDVRRIYAGLVGAVHAGERIAFFPEGTTTEQGQLLPFHANLFEAAIEAAVPVQPYALRYLDASGAPHPAVAFIGDMSFAQSIAAILRAREIRAELVRLPVIETAGAHRRDIASKTRQSVAQALGHPES
ncbi:1-acyl-sn-glycerol-3-phosphate acyltransferase [Herminiimonas sp. CN]|uniref:lysophospholipid acyltransferase family protein n=1 Tax=Herminiimonas sp. CN TaxID=1349818 RepID=UPI0004740653|nr:lysophospholipid acyltransferase family protein [Herminiimonas sp. CN]